MGSSFFEFNIATTGLFAAKAGLEVTSHNVANMGTLGYSRQYIKQRATTPLNRYSGVGQVGTGTEVYGIGQYRDVYLDKKYWSQNSTYGEYYQKTNQLNIAQAIFSELSDTGLTKNINTFFEVISELNFSANDLNYRTAVINNADTLVTNIRNHAHNLREQQIDLNEDVYSLVERINAIGSQLANLNDQIYRFEIEGQTANELRDQRTLLLDELSKYVNIETKEVSDGTGRELGVKFTVLINGQEFVNHDSPRKLECVRRGDGNPLHTDDAPNLYDVTWQNGEKLNLNGLQGELKGILDIRDGDSGVGGGGSYKGIPYYISKLNEFVRTIAIAFNEGTKLDGTKLEGVIGHKDGFDMNGNAGGVFFTKIQEDGTTAPDITNYDEINAFNFAVSDELKKDSSKLAASDTNDPTQESNNKVILGFIKLKDDVSLFAEGGAYQFVNAISATLAIDTKQAENFSKYYKDITTTVDNQRMQVSGVSLNEEVSNIVKYQHLYQTASKLINVINEIYNTTINGLGI
ncbi:MAG: flagellar hook-associated protein FlgK [Eubacteriales bacterium]|nr:flagellar hook-associated protein FlgK [Eubacteriales bacterium]